MSTPKPEIEKSWGLALENEFRTDYFMILKSFLLEERNNHQIYPPGPEIFNAFNFTPFDQVKVVILGQDPYHGKGQAHGLSFSVPQETKPPPSLQNIFKEIENDLGIPPPKHGNLEHWAKQGVLLLNATLTVRANQAGSHQGKGWEQFTNQAIRKLSEERFGIVFLLWGKFAQDKEELIDTGRHYILKAPHPSPFSANRGFFGCRHFSKTNKILKKIGRQEIDWSLGNSSKPREL
ncbi:MAG: uracil-DNA glycosylase [Bacteroidales bacterium]|nr:uracil-DNA glycosylase [Bacteroidales bacterium]MCF8387514.1 uracil-DNA glycosylase [Bacteroidales bacterium]MCF8398322.1 uracil-DNA glycosylase [Bacteroidales bacterium]